MIFIIGLLLGAVVVLFVLQNIIPVTVAFFAWQIHGTLAFILLLSILAGMLISALLSVPEMIKKELKVSHLKKHNKKLEEELETHKQRLNEAQMTAPAEPIAITQIETVTTVQEMKEQSPSDRV